MHHDDPIFIVRRRPVSADNQIPLDEWLAYLSSSSVITAKPPTEWRGINLFTKQPTVFRSPPGSAIFQGQSGPCEIEYHAGSLIVRGTVGHAEETVTQIANALNAEV